MSDQAASAETTLEDLAAAAPAEWVSLDELLPWDKNPRRNANAIEPVARSIWRFGFGPTIVARRADRRIIAGHTRQEAVRFLLTRTAIVGENGQWLGWRERTPADGPFVLRGAPGPGLVPVRYVELDDREARAFALADNRLAEIAEWDPEALSAELRSLAGESFNVEGLGFGDAELAELLGQFPPAGPPPGPEAPRPTLADQFIVPPFSVLDARQGYWQERKRAWVAIGLQSELGRGVPVPSETPSEQELVDGRKKGLTWGQSEAMTDPTLNAYRKANKKKREPNAIPGGQPMPLDRAKSRKAADGRSNLNGAPATPEWATGTGTANMAPGTSIFDPVLCELAYRWFSPAHGSVLDPFAGGSVRGILAALLGRAYTGIDLRPEQIAANEEQWARISARSSSAKGPADPLPVYEHDPDALTPIQRVRLPNGGSVALKREDLYAVDDDGRLNGSKPRALIELARRENAVGLVAASSRMATMGSRVALAAKILGLPCRIHVPSGEETTETRAARAYGAELITQSPGYLTVLQARGRKDAEERGWLYVPLGLEHPISIEQVRKQAANIPRDGSIKRIVVTVGSGTALAGVLWGMADAGIDLPVLGVCVREDEIRKKVVAKLSKEAPPDWESRVKLVPCGLAYDAEASVSKLDGVQLDPVYEAKILPFLEDGDLFWIVGIRGSARAHEQSRPLSATTPRWICGDSARLAELVPESERFDLIFSCPPYGDLEVYSEDPLDLSTMDRTTFLAAYRGIIHQAVSRLKDNRFAVFVVGDYRDKAGFYSNFVSETIAAFEGAGARLYNEGILLTSVGSLPIRVGKQFASGRKLGKTHQNVLVFYKGDPARIRGDLGLVEVTLPEQADPEAQDVVDGSE